MKEIWKPIPGYEKYYMASNFGRIKSLSRTSRPNHRPDIILSQFVLSNGYKSVNLSVNGRRKQMKVHRLVMFAFCGERSSDVQVNHIDGDKTNNNLSNLEYVTALENKIHSIKVLKNGVGELSGRSKLTVSDVRKIRELCAEGTHTKMALGRMFGVRDTAIHKIINRENWAWLD